MKKRKTILCSALLLPTLVIAGVGYSAFKAPVLSADYASRSALFAPLAVASTVAESDSDSLASTIPADAGNIVDEVEWVVGDEPILKSDIEVMRIAGKQEGMQFKGDPDCAIPEQLAVQKLYLHQAALDSIEVTESEIAQGVDQQINYWVQMLGSREKLEEYRKEPITQIRQDLHDEYKNSQLIRKMQQKLVEKVKVSPADVRAYFKELPPDSIPLIPTTVEAQIITIAPKIPQEEIDRVRNQLREFTDRVNSGQTSFATLARLYSEDPGSARQGGELGYMGRGMLDPAFAAVAFNLTDPKKVSKIVETDFGYHIIQLIDKRGERINVRHILLKPKVSQEAIDKAELRLDSIRNDIVDKKFTFDEAAAYISEDKDTRNNHGYMVNSVSGDHTSRFEMKDLPTEVAKAVEGLAVDSISRPFQMVNDKGKTVCAIVKLKSRVEAHRATITEDFQTMKDIVEQKEKEKVLHDWVENKIKTTYVKMAPQYRNCNFEYSGWIKQ